MATSSIFHKVVIDTPDKAEQFIAALEASEEAEVKAAKNSKSKAKSHFVSDPKEVRKLVGVLNRRKNEK